MRVAIMEAHGYLDKQIQRLLANHEIKGDIVPNLTRSVVQQYDVLVVTHKTDIPNVPVVLEQIILDGDINVIYVSNNPNI